MTFTAGMLIKSKDTGYTYRVSAVTTRIVVISTESGHWKESISHAVASILYEAA